MTETVAEVVDETEMGSKEYQTRIKRRWDALQGKEHEVALGRAKLLHDVWVRNQRSDKLLAQFLVTVLGEFKGKRCKTFVRLARTYDSISDPETWAQVGGRGVEFFTAMEPRDVRRTMTKVRAVLKNTGRSCLSVSTLRGILRTILGEKEYQSLLSERKTSTGGSLRVQLQALKSFVLTMLEEEPTLRRRLSREVRHALGLDLVR